MDNLPARPSLNRRAIRLAVVYALAAGAWILFSDELTTRFTRDPLTWQHWQLAKGLFFVAVTSIGLYLMTRRDLRTLDQQHRERERQQAISMRLQTELSRREAYFERIMETAHEGIWTIDTDGNTDYVNPAMADMLGYNVAEMQGRPMFDFMDAEGRDIATTNLERRRQGVAERHDFRFIRKDGTPVWTQMNTNPLVDGSGAVVGALAMVTDITEQRRMIEALQESESRFRALFDSSPVALWEEDFSGMLHYLRELQAVHGDGLESFLLANPAHAFEAMSRIRILNVNAETLRLFEADSMAALLGRLDAVVDFSDTREIVRSQLAALSGQPGYGHEVVNFTLHGRRLEIDMQWTVLPGHEHDYSRVILVTYDMTELVRHRHNLERSREEYRALAAHLDSVREEERAAIAREMHDEFGQVQTVLKLELAILEKSVKMLPPQADRAPFERGIATMNGLLDRSVRNLSALVSRLRPNVLENLGLVEGLEWLIEELRRNSRMKWTVTLPETEPRIPEATATVVYRIAQEALTNVARHARASAGHLTLDVGDGHLLLTIRDDGQGFTNEPDAFPGHFGLLGMRERAEQLQGSLTITTSPGNGTTVRLELPFDAPPAPEK